ncbi:MAG: S41 family peptidase [Paludibacteraceae bacterium]|nr:S41 family peptidase [Paludibacteraceae bacterium]
MKKRILSIALASLLLPLSQAAEKRGTREFETSKNLDIFNSIYKELDMLYVDTIQPEKEIKYGIDAMLNNLDPYTTYIPESEMDNLKFMTTGEYAGVGAIIGERNGEIYISEIYEGMPAFKSGLKTGDVFIEIDGQSLNGKTTSQASELLKGQAKTIVKVKVRRNGKEEIKIDVMRDKISIPPVSYSTIKDGIGYINFSSFTEKSGDAFADAFAEMKKKGIKALVIDLRNNPGGILGEAVRITNLFVEKKSTIVYTQGKVKQWDETYKATREPVDRHIPIAVLVNRNSASAAEILAGSLQDLDRAAIVGERTYGKGLVQTTRNLPYGGNLKVTISKYYIPSGRCIQAIDYSRRSKDGYVQRIPDSLTTEFKTAKGRIVRDGGGINPDLYVEPEKGSTIAYYLYSNNLIFDYVNIFQEKHETIGSLNDFKFEDYEDFKKFVKEKNFSYKLKTEEVLNSLKEIAKEEGYFESSSEEFKALEGKLSHNVEKDLDLFKDEIVDLISIEIAKRYYYQKGEIAEMLKRDKTFKAAVELLNDNARYDQLLSPKATTEETKKKTEKK